MKMYRFSEEEFACLEGLRVPLAVYQFRDRRVVVRVLSAGFCDLFDFETREEAYPGVPGSRKRLITVLVIMDTHKQKSKVLAWVKRHKQHHVSHYVILDLHIPQLAHVKIYVARLVMVC